MRESGQQPARPVPLEHDPATVMPGSWTEVDDPVGIGHHGLVVLDHYHRLARIHELVEKTEQVLDIGEMQPARRLVEHVKCYSPPR